MPSYVVVWILLIFAWAANFVIRVGFSALLPSIIDELGLSYTRAGLLASAFFYAYVHMQIPAGLLGDRFGRRRILLSGLLGGALAAGLTGLAGSFAALFLARADGRPSGLALLERPGHHRDRHAGRSDRPRSGRVVLRAGDRAHVRIRHRRAAARAHAMAARHAALRSGTHRRRAAHRAVRAGAGSGGVTGPRRTAPREPRLQ